jgi:F420-dependent oxidoreductase-like protein
MKLGLVLGYSGANMTLPIERVLEAERLGFDSVWSSEAYGSDAVTPAAWVLARTTRIKVGTAIMQMPARTPVMTAMTAMTLDVLSGGRFILGIGPSGPQVVEGWHGVAYGKPLLRTREYIEIIRKILDRSEPLTYSGEHYQIPHAGPGATGLGKPLKSILHGNPRMKIYTATITPASIRNSAEIADGMIPVFMDPQRFELFEPHLNAGFVKTGNRRSLATYDICPFVPVSMGDDIEAARLPIKQHLALYVGGMGAREKNFHNDYTQSASATKPRQSASRMPYRGPAITPPRARPAIPAPPRPGTSGNAGCGRNCRRRWCANIVTTFDVPAERRSTAALDRRHHYC